MGSEIAVPCEESSDMILHVRRDDIISGSKVLQNYPLLRILCEVRIRAEDRVVTVLMILKL